MAARWQYNEHEAVSSAGGGAHTAPARFRHLTRVADMLKDSMATKRTGAPSPPNVPTEEQIPATSTYPLDRRRSTSQRIHAAWSSMTSSKPKLESCGINHLPIELLQNILLHLDFYTLLRIRRVCKLWNDLIPGDSPILQEVLFLKPSKHLEGYDFTPATFDLDFDIVPEKSSPTFMAEQKVFHVSEGFFRLGRRCLGLIRTSSEFIFHPVIMEFDQFMQMDEFRFSPFSNHGDQQGGDQHVTQSWRNMLISMPPLREVRICRRTEGNYSLHVLRVLTADDGLRLGDVFDALSAWKPQNKDETKPNTAKPGDQYHGRVPVQELAVANSQSATPRHPPHGSRSHK